MSKRPLNVGLVGGGRGAFIVHPHQRAINMDGTRRVTAGALFPDPKIALEEAANWAYPIRGYGSYDEMIAANASLPDEEKLDYILIVTPNHVHFDPAMKALKAGIPVFCEKPLCLNLKEANALVKEVRKRNIPFGVAHTYLGHWTTRLSRFIVRSGLIGEVRWVDSYYLQGWLATKLEATGQQQASWRVDPKRAGVSGCGGDIGTHALMHLRYVTGLEVTHVSAQLETFVEGRPLDDHFTVYCRLNNGGKALVRASQICIGHKNDLGILIAGTKGTVEWRQEEPEKLVVYLNGQPDRVYWRGAVTPGDGFLPKDMPADLLAEVTIPSGHPEGFHDAFARLHRCFEADVRAWKEGKPFQCDGSKYANVEDGWMGIAFLETCVKSSKNKGAWTAMPKKI
ncbi:Gfo/Idh/MocA family oxidoreductase [Limisphaera ngatamarikiensis]|uniref:Gfo/Idh/MocA family oxidoreductase n=1 Tax=Limisphaera ngatamarikiensis TaxID=1324935 RepID=A0A6M1RRC8_9BACT|nr:Gfo/Idh/MocA family oxidoreductase [Limisphaera ngatamarikiensis]NGO40203.1 Gfo/Idh/MocA family oxidoreductase [Limisphaera ngatamarikiensis]